MDKLKMNNEDNMKKYLKKLMELESEKYRLEEIKEKIYCFNYDELSAISNKNLSFYTEKKMAVDNLREAKIKHIKDEKERKIKSKLDELFPPNRPMLKLLVLIIGVF